MADKGAEKIPNLSLTAEEKRVYGHLFRQADSGNAGVVTGEVAVKFFDKTQLDSRVLGEIWQIADKENRGFLTPAGFGVVLRLIGHAQAGREPTPEIALRPGPIPRFDGMTVAPPPHPIPISPPAGLVPQVTGGNAAGRIPPLTPEKVAQYAALFERQNLQNGSMLPGDQAKQIFEKSGLPNEVLGRIWMLADTEQRGALVMTEFVIATHLLTSIKTGALHTLPSILPAALYEAATRRSLASPRQQSPTTANAPLSAISRQLSGQAAPLKQMRTGSPQGPSPMLTQGTGDWLITPPDKARFDQLYAELDKTNKGYITGEEAVPFFSQSNLPENTLAQIWDLADVNTDGQLNKDEFAVAMYLIRQQRSKKDGSVGLPSTLSPNLIPPSMRAQVRAQTVGGAFAPPPQAQVVPPVPPPSVKPSALHDLFGLDESMSTPTPPQPHVAVATGSSAISDPFGGNLSPAAPSSPIRPSPTGAQYKPFVPSSTFGRGLTAQPTGGSTGCAPGGSASSMSRSPLPVSVSDDLLGDNDDTGKAISNDATELANLSNQISSLTKQMQDVQSQRTTTQNNLNQTGLQKKNFEQRLAQLRNMYEKEAQDVRALEQQLMTCKNETKKLQSEIGMIEASHQDLRNQNQQLLTALQNDQQEKATLKEHIRTVNAELAQLKPQIERLKSEARHQKGLVAISKKQLATVEAERDKVKTEVEDLTKSNEELARQAPPSSPVLPTSSPALSATSGKNPFFRRTGSTDIAGAFSPPIQKTFNDKSFDDVFGPSPFPSGTQTSPPPSLAAFGVKQQNTGASNASVGSGSFATPSSVTPSASRQGTVMNEPPPPLESRQISSTNLPFVAAPESLSSSRQVSPPLSRMSVADPSDSQATLAPGPQLEPASTGQSFTSASAKSDTDKPRPSSPTDALEESTSKAAAVVGTPGAFPVDDAKAKEDFESAFASFKQARGSTRTSSATEGGPAFANFHSEFPPISELEHDESDSDSEQAGFDDDFAPASPPPADKKAESPAVSKPASSIVVAKASVPEQVEGVAETSASVVADPSTGRKRAASPMPSSTSFGTQAISRVDDMFGAAATTLGPAAPATAPCAQAASAPSAGGAFEDLEDDFVGLEDAKEGSGDDDFANISRSGLDDFNPVFDSPPSQAKTESQTTSSAFGNENSFDFGSLSTTSGAQPSSKPQATFSDSHDWDAIFASLDDAPKNAPQEVDNGAAKESLSSGIHSFRPEAPGRALTEEGIHDDPILKNLTSMGYPRRDALAALEKYDYNLERAANYLASQS